VPNRRLEDRIRELCSKVVRAHDHELPSVISELKSALHEHNQRFRSLAAAKLLAAKRGLLKERRSA
jgi:hypothetical protein